MLQSKLRLVVFSTALLIISGLGIAAAGNPSSTVFVDQIKAFLGMEASVPTSLLKQPASLDGPNAPEATSLIAGWDFQTTTNGGTAVAAAPNSPTTLVSNVGSGTMYLNGTNGSSTWITATSGNELSAFGGTALNAGTGMSTTTTSPAAIALIGGTANSANGKSASFKFSMAGKQNLVVSYATQGTAAGFQTQTWQYSTDGASWTNAEAVGSIPTSFAVKTLGTITALDNATNAYLRVTFTGATASSGNNRLDNVQFNATDIPQAPAVTGISPSSGYTSGGASVTITGTNFTGATGVTFGGTAAQSFTVNSATQITAVSPAHVGEGSVDIVVTTPGGNSPVVPAGSFTYVNQTPTITSVSPNSGPTTGGTAVTVTGAGFTGATGVTFSGQPPTSFTVVDDSHLTTTSPANSAGVADVRITAPGGTTAITAADQFTYIAQIATTMDLGSDHTTATTGDAVKFTSVLTAQSGPAANSNITWRAPHTISADSDVSTVGTLVSAVNVANTAPVTLNGVTFQPLPAGGASADGVFSFASGEANSGYNGYGNPGVAPYSGLSSNYQTLLTYGNFGSGNSPMTLTLNSLTVGSTYQFEVWINDSRGNNPQPINVTSGSTTVHLLGNAYGFGGGVGQFVTGTFTADAATKVITFQGDNGYGTLENAFMLRQLSQPTPPVSGKTVAFHDGADCAAPTLGTGTTDANGAATFTTTALTEGTHTITACFDGDANYAASSKAVTVVVHGPPTVTLGATSLTDFGSVVAGQVSGAQSTSLTASNLNGESIYCTFQNYNFQLSTDGSAWNSGGMLIAAPGGSFNGTLYVRFSPQASTGGAVSGNIVCQTYPGGLSQKLLAVSGTDLVPPGVYTVPGAAIEGQAYSYNLLYQGYPAPSCSRTGGDPIPSGITLNSDCTLSGTASVGSMGTYHVTVKATNGIAPDFESTVTIQVYGTPVITNANSATVTVGTSLNFQFTANSNPANVWQIQSGSFPSGVTFPDQQYSGLLSGIPANGTAGDYVVVMRANNGFFFKDQTFTLHVVNPTVEPTVTASGATAISTSGATLNANVTSDGNGTITERGFYFKQGTGVLNTDAKITVAGGTGAYSFTKTGLAPGTQYSYRGFAKNSAGETVSTEQTFFTGVVLTYTAGTGGTITGTTPQTLAYGADGTQVTAVADTANHYHFVNWSDGNANPSRTDTAVHSSATYTANFALDQFSVIYNGNGSDGGTNPGTQTADYGTQVNLKNNTFTRTGYNFTGWNTTAAGSGTHYPAGAAFTIPASNTTLYAEWSLASVATTTGVTSSLNPSSFGQPVTLTATVLTQGTGLPVTQGTAAIYDNGVAGSPGCSGTQLASGTPNAQGKITYTSNSLGGGIHSITACYTGTAPYQDSNGSLSQSVNKKTQTITFNAIGDQPYTAGNVTFIASTDSGLQLDFTSLDTSVCTIPSLHVGQANFVKAGLCKIVASQAGNADYSAATSVEQDFNILKVTPTITFGTAPTAVYPGSNFTVTATTNNPESSTVTFSYVSGPCSQVSGGTFSPTGVGNCVIKADGAATTNYNAATAQQTVAITAAPPSVQFTSANFIGNESENGAVTITRTGDTSGSSSVLFSTVSGGTATGGATCNGTSDYVTITNQSISFAAGEGNKTVNVQLCGDNVADPNETINLALTSPSNATLGQNTAVITINDTASAYRNATQIDVSLGAMGAPSTINVTGAPSQIGSMRVTLYDVSETMPDNLEVLLVDPTGTKTYVLMASAGGPTPIDPTAPVTLTFNDNAADVLPDSSVLLTGEYKPTTWTSVSSFPPPAPPNSGGTVYTLPGNSNTRPAGQTMRGRFSGINPNGNWTLYVRDDAGSPFVNQVVGSVAGGWGLQILGPTAAGVDVSGRVRAADGSGLARARVQMTDSKGNVRTVTTNAFGYYTFEDVRLGDAYIMAVDSRRYTYATRVLQVFDSMADVDFTPNQ